MADIDYLVKLLKKRKRIHFDEVLNAENIISTKHILYLSGIKDKSTI